MLARDGVRRSLNELRATRRSRRAERAAVEATLEEEAFDPDVIRGAVSEILRAAEATGGTAASSRGALTGGR